MSTSSNLLSTTALVLRVLTRLNLLVGLPVLMVCKFFSIHFATDFFSVDGWLGVLLTFILAGVFEAGTRLRADLDGTV